jgi:hypothetical protein
MVPVFDGAVNVNVAWINVPAFRTAFCRFQVKVSEEPAPLGVNFACVFDVHCLCCGGAWV